jgi:DNA-binding PadR family transcriptional regulator
MYPYEVTTTLRERGKEDSIRLNFGSLYSVIKSLQKHGMIEPLRSEREGNRPERIVYAITDEGRLEADAWLRELLELPTKEYPAIETGLSLLPMVPPDEACTLLRKRVRRLQEEIDRRERDALTPEYQAVPELFLIEADFKVAMLKAERDVIAVYAERIGAGALGGQDLWIRLYELLAEGRTVAEAVQGSDPIVGEGVVDGSRT